MNYYDAARIRKKGFAKLMTERLASGQGIVSSVRGSLSDRSMAKSMAMKERYDPMNIAKFLTGGSNLAPAIVGRLMGRSKQDIRYFTGKKQYETRNRPNYYEKFNPSMGGGRSGKATEILEKIVSFMKESSEKDLEEQDTLDSYNEMNEYMKEDNHKEVMNVFEEAIKNKRKAMKDMVKESKKRAASEKVEQKKKEAPAPAPAAPTRPAPAPAPAAPTRPAPAPAPATPTATPTPPVVTPKPAIVKPAITEAAKTAAKIGVIGTAALVGREALAKNIAKYESTGSAGKSFGNDEYNAYNKGTTGNKIVGATKEIDFSKMTISEYFRRSKLPITDPDRLFAVGRYQIIPKTMEGLVKKLKIDPDTTTLNAETQDMLFARGLTTSLQGRGAVDNYLKGKPGVTREDAILALAMEFASIGVPYDIPKNSLFNNKLPNIDLKKGQSFYSGIGGNKAHNPPELVGAALDEDRKKNINMSPTTTTNNIGEKLNDASKTNDNMKVDMSSSSAAGSVAPIIIQNNNTNKQKIIQPPSAPLGELNPRMGN